MGGNLKQKMMGEGSKVAREPKPLSLSAHETEVRRKVTKREACQTSIARRSGEQIVVYSCHELLLSNREK